jgi:hypothetical protein
MTTIKRWKIFSQVAAIVALLLIVKFVLYKLDWEVLSVTPLHTGILAGSVFVLGFILSSTHTDYKESEKMPVDVVTALESLYLDGKLFAQDHPDFPLKEYREALAKIPLLIKEDIQHHKQNSIEQVKLLSPFFKQMENMDMPANYIVKLKADQNVALKWVNRMYYLLRIKPLPSGFVLVEFIVYTVIGMLMFTQMTTILDGLVVTGFIAFLYLYIFRLIQIMDIPFHKEGSTQDDVSLFLLEQQHERFMEEE